MGRREVDDYFSTSLLAATADTIVFRGRGLLYAVAASGIGAAGSVAIRAGVNALAPIKAYLYAQNGGTAHLGLKEAVLFENGCFLDVAATTSVTVQWAPAPPDFEE